MKIGKAVFAGLVVAMAAASAWAQDAPTYAERLGWPKGAKVVMFHNDDVGMSRSSNDGTIQALEYGLVTSVSTMMPCYWVPGWLKYLKEHPEVDNGLHLTLTSEWDLYRWHPVTGMVGAPGLADNDGYLHDNVPLVVEHATPDEVEAEIRAQIAKAEKMGMPITHIDSHMGTLFATPEFLERYIKVGIEKQLPVLIAGGHATHVRKENGEIFDMFLASGLPEKVWAAGLPVLDDIHTDSYGWKTHDVKKKGMIEFLRTLKPGVTEVIMHASRPSVEFPIITDSSELREADLSVMIDPEIKKIVEEEGIILTTWRELKQRRDAVKE